MLGTCSPGRVPRSMHRVDPVSDGGRHRSISVCLADRSRRRVRRLPWLLLLLLVPQALVGTNAMVRSKRIPISSSYATANWIREQKIPPERLMGFKIFPTLGVAAYLEEPFYFPEMKGETAVLLADKGHKMQ